MRCKATIDCYPPTRCSRAAQTGKEWCWQHDRDRRRAESKRRHQRDRILENMRFARGDVSRARRLVCTRAREFLEGTITRDSLRLAVDALETRELEVTDLERELETFDGVR